MEQDHSDIYHNQWSVCSRETIKLVNIAMFTVVVFYLGSLVLGLGLELDMWIAQPVGVAIFMGGLIALLIVDGKLYEVNSKRKQKALLMELLRIQAKVLHEQQQQQQALAVS